MIPKHTPYDGSQPSFGIGLQPLELANWIELDSKFENYLREKRRLMKTIPEKIFFEGDDCRAAQQEVLDLLVPHLLQNFSEVYARQANRIKILDGAFSVDLEDNQLSPLLKAAYLVQEDLVLMRRREDGWFLVAASVCFPSSWVLAEKAGKIIQDIHAPVPGFGRGTRNAVMIERIFDNLLVDQPVERFMTSDLVSVRQDTDLKTIVHHMLEAHIHRVIVIGADDRVQGIVSTTDVLAALMNPTCHA